MSRLLFRGFKTFWKTKSSINIAIIEHSDQNIFEVIAYDPVLGQHAPRLHINAYTVRVIMTNNTNHLNINESEDEEMVVDGAVAKFLFNHIVLVEYLPMTKFIRIDVQPVFNSERSLKDYPFVVDRPCNLLFYPSPFDTELSNEETTVYEFGCVRQLQLSRRDKWRLPLILVRVSKSLPLQESDAKIWACFVHNKTQEALIKCVALALAVRIPTESRAVFQSAVHTALLPEQCPFPVKTTTTTSVYCSNIPHIHTAKTTPYASRRNSRDTTILIKSISEKNTITTDKKQEKQKRRIHSLHNFWPLSYSTTTIVPVIEEQDHSEIALGLQTFGTIGNTKMNKFSKLNSSFILSKAPRRRSFGKILSNWAGGLLHRHQRIVPTTTVVM